MDPVDKNGDVQAQAILVVEDITAQGGIARKDVAQDVRDRGAGCDDRFRRRDTRQMSCESDTRHAGRNANAQGHLCKTVA